MTEVKTPTVWTASMIGANDDLQGSPLLRREFGVDQGHGAVTGAVLHATARGVFTALLNGTPVSDDVLAPGWSSYQWRLRYRSYEVTDLIQQAGNGRAVLGFELGNGWYRGRLGWSGNRAVYGPELGVLAQLEIQFADGHRQTVGTDETWRAGPSGVLANDLYDGQTIDARLVDTAWQRPGFADDEWTGVHAQDFDYGTLVPQVGPPVRRQEEIQAVKVWKSPSGRTLVDFGQNLVGWVRFEVQGSRGSTITVSYAEVLDGGELGTGPLRSAEATDRLILSGGKDLFEPTLTFHGFQYIEVDGWPGELPVEAITAVVVHSDMRRTGAFECSDALLNQLHSNVVWGTRGNFLDVPTDCPQRDERLGWTGDIAVYAPTAAFLFDVNTFLRDWLADLIVEQQAGDGRMPWVIPDIYEHTEWPAEFASVPDTTAIWGDAAVWVPWALWQAYGDRDVLAQTFDSMVAHVRHVETLLSPTGLWDQGFQFGDWLDPTAPPERADLAKADPGVVATASLYRSAQITAEVAGILGRDAEAAAIQALGDRTRAAFNRHYVHDDGLVTSDSQTGYALAIVFGLLDEPAYTRAGERLADLVAGNGYRIATGFAGTPFILDALTITGHLDTAYRMLLERECPSWLYPVTMGATTIWERWDSMLPDGSINPGGMTSFNHYALGAVADWMHRVIGGIAPAEPGYRTVHIAPRPGGDITWAKSSLTTATGELLVEWQVTPTGGFDLDITVPDGVTAVVDVPGLPETRYAAGRHQINGRVPATATAAGRT